MQALALTRPVVDLHRMADESEDRRTQKLIGQALRILRERANLSQEEAARRFGVESGPAWSKYERGLAPSIHQPDVQRRLAAAVNASTEELALERARVAGQEVAHRQATGAGETARSYDPTPLPGMVPVYGRPAGPGRVDLQAGAELRFIPIHPAQRGYRRPGVYEVVGEDMHPRWKPRELAYFVFDLDPPRGEDVVVELASGGAIIREYIGRTKEHVSLRRYYPDEQTEDFAIAEIEAMHAVVG